VPSAWANGNTRHCPPHTFPARQKPIAITGPSHPSRNPARSDQTAHSWHARRSVCTIPPTPGVWTPFLFQWQGPQQHRSPQLGLQLSRQVRGQSMQQQQQLHSHTAQTAATQWPSSNTERQTTHATLLAAATQWPMLQLQRCRHASCACDCCSPTRSRPVAHDLSSAATPAAPARQQRQDRSVAAQQTRPPQHASAAASGTADAPSEGCSCGHGAAAHTMVTTSDDALLCAFVCVRNARSAAAATWDAKRGVWCGWGKAFFREKWAASQVREALKALQSSAIRLYCQEAAVQALTRALRLMRGQVRTPLICQHRIT
jgi:hypothetical protein